MAYSDQPAELIQQSPPTSNPSSQHILHGEDLLWLKWRREALPQQFSWQPGVNSNFLQAGCNKPLEAVENVCPELGFFKNWDGKNQTKCKKPIHFPYFHIKKSNPKVIKVNSFSNHWIRQSSYPRLNYNPVLKISGVEPTPNLWPAANKTASGCLKILFHPSATYKWYNKEAVHVKTKPRSNLLVASISFGFGVGVFLFWCSQKLLQIIWVLNFSWLCTGSSQWC